jgi:hypothetical protein
MVTSPEIQALEGKAKARKDEETADHLETDLNTCPWIFLNALNAKCSKSSLVFIKKRYSLWRKSFLQTNSAWETSRKTHEVARDQDALDAARTMVFGPQRTVEASPLTLAAFEGGGGEGFGCVGKVALKERAARVPNLCATFGRVALPAVPKPNFLHIFDFTSCGPLKMNALASLQGVLPHLPGVKLILMPEIPLRHEKMNQNLENESICKNKNATMCLKTNWFLLVSIHKDRKYKNFMNEALKFVFQTSRKSKHHQKHKNPSNSFVT